MNIEKSLHRNIFIQRLHEAINRRGYITIKELSEQTGIKYTTILTYLNGSCTPNIYHLQILCRFLHVSSDYLIQLNER